MPLPVIRAIGLLSTALLAVSMPADAQDIETPLSAFATRKAELLLRDALPCLGCHQLNGDGGRVGPDLTTVRTRRSAAYIAAMVADPQRTVPGTPMPLTLMPEATRDLIVRYLATHSRPSASAVAVPPGVVPPAPPASRNAPAVYAQYCAACHGAAGRGDGPNAAYLPVKPAVHASSDAMSKRSDDALYDTIAGGGAIMNRSPRMPAFGATLTGKEIRSLVAYIRRLCACRGPAWSLTLDSASDAPGRGPASR